MKLIIAILPTVLLTIYSQLITKWRVTALMAGQEAPLTMKARLIMYLSDPIILSAFACSFLAGVAWFAVAEKYPASIAFPTYVGVLFMLVLLGSSLFLGERVSLQHLAGIGLILLGVVVASRAHG